MREQAMTGKVSLSYVLYLFCMVNALIGIILHYSSSKLYSGYVAEDGYVEYMTAFLLLGLSIYTMRKGAYLSDRPAKILYFLGAFMLFFAFGEEVSWGQRLLGFSTPEELKAINEQDEFNLHNLNLNGLSINRLIFGTLLYTAVISYFLLVPYLSQKNKQIKNLIKTFKIPVPRRIQSVLYLLAFALLHSIPHRSWEIQELTLISFICLVVIFPANPEDL